MGRKAYLGLVAAGTAVALVAACSPSKPSGGGGSGSGTAGTTSSKSTITIATTTDVANFNPLLGVSFSDYWVTDLMYPTLMAMDQSGNKVPSVATKWGYTSPTQGYFDLRSDMKWSDGKPLTADDVAWEMNAIVRDKPAGVVTGFMNNFASAKATSPTHVDITLSKPDSTLIPEVGFWMRIIPEHIWDKVGNIGKYANSSNWVAAGPYRLTSFKKGQSYTMVRVTPYPMAPNGTPTLQKVIFRVYPDVNTELLALKNGDVDVVGNSLPPSQVKSLKATSGIQVADVPGLGYTFMTYNVKHKPLDNKLVREALAHAVDNKTIQNVVVQGQAVSTNSEAIAPVLKQWVDPNAKEYTFDTSLSKQLLTQAGYHQSGGKFPLSLRLVYSLVDPVTSQMATLVRDEAAQAGITIKLQGVDRNTFLQKGADGDFDIYLGSFSIEDNPITGMLLAFEPGAANNYTFANDPHLLDLLHQAQNATDQATQIKFAQQAAEYVKDNVYDNVLFMQNLEVAYRSGWTNLVVEPSQLLSIVNPESLSHAVHSG
jgi:peptide/nickel transport system substrate-binding protein